MEVLSFVVVKLVTTIRYSLSIYYLPHYGQRQADTCQEWGLVAQHFNIESRSDLSKIYFVFSFDGGTE